VLPGTEGFPAIQGVIMPRKVVALARPKEPLPISDCAAPPPAVELETIGIASTDAPEPTGDVLAELATAIGAACLWPKDASPLVNTRLDIGRNIGGTPITLSIGSSPGEEAILMLHDGEGAMPEFLATKGELTSALHEHGYEIGPETVIFTRPVIVRTPIQANALAREILHLMTDTFGWDSTQPLKIDLHNGGQLSDAQVFKALRPSELVELLKGWSFRAEIKSFDEDEDDDEDEESTPPVISTGMSGLRVSITMYWKRGTGYASLNFKSLLRCTDPVSLDKITKINRSSRFIKVYLDSDDDVIAEMDISFAGGVTTDWLRAAVNDFDKLLHLVTTELANSESEAKTIN